MIRRHQFTTLLQFSAFRKHRKQNTTENCKLQTENRTQMQTDSQVFWGQKERWGKAIEVVCVCCLFMNWVLVFLFLQKFRSSGAKETLKEEAIESLKAMVPTPAKVKGPPSPVQALLGGLSAGVIALILYKFTTTIEGALNRQTLSDNFSVRQITITIRWFRNISGKVYYEFISLTIVNGLCYLATFVFGINSIGLFLYSGQLAINSIMGDSGKETENKNKAQGSSNPMAKTPSESLETGNNNGDKNSDSTQ